jgi:RNA polymerase sigma-70 factor (ECF subfamily)
MSSLHAQTEPWPTRLLHAMWRIGRPPVADSESQLIAAARGGDREALGALYRRHAGQAYSLALRISGDPDRAQDLVQDAFLRAFERLDRFRGDAPFGAWLKRILTNLSVDRARGDWRWVLDEERLEAEPAAAVEAASRIDALGLLARLAPMSRMVLVLYEYEGYSHAEIAALLQRTEVWSKTTLSRGRARLADWLAEEGA